MQESERKQRNIAQYRALGMSLAQASRLADIKPRRPVGRIALLVGLGVSLLGLGGYGVLQQQNADAAVTVAMQSGPTQPEQNGTDQDPISDASAAFIDPPVMAPNVTVATAETALPIPIQTQDTAELDAEPAQIAPTPLASATVDTPAPLDCVDALQAYARDVRIGFDVGATAMSDTGRNQIRAFATVAQGCSDAQIIVAGHSDLSGDAALNMKLSWDRADATLAVIDEMGFDTSRMQPLGFGARRPLTEGGATDDDDLNRRVEFIISRMADTRGTGE